MRNFVINMVIERHFQKISLKFSEELLLKNVTQPAGI